MVNSPLNATFPPEGTGHPLLVDPAALDYLLAELDHDEAALDAFIDAFLLHWPERLRRAQGSIDAADLAAVLDCALSIKVSSDMVGATRLSRCGGDLESMALSGRLDQAAPLLGALRSVGDETRRALALARNRELSA